MDRLTVRQRQVAELIADGLQYKQIAVLLDIGVDRVKTIVERVAEIIGDPEDGLESRDTVLVYVRQHRWAVARAAELPLPSRGPPQRRQAE